MLLIRAPGYPVTKQVRVVLAILDDNFLTVRSVKAQSPWRSSVILISAGLASASYEKMCLLFNIGALQSQIAASQNLTSDDGLKTAAKYFQVNIFVL